MEPIVIQTLINAPVAVVWKSWTDPQHIVHWAFASSDWHAPTATNDMRVGGTFVTRMESTDGTQGFDFTGTYTDIIEHKHIAYIMDDGRKVKIDFAPQGEQTIVTETFDPESENTIEMQRNGWQAILHSFKRYVESQL